MFYWKNAISNDDLISKNLENQWNYFKDGKDKGVKYTELMISTCGKAYLNFVSTQFEFYSVRSDQSNDSLYLTSDLGEICEVISVVQENVLHCCEKMKRFNDAYMKKKGMDNLEFFSEHIHPRTYSGNSQQHMERVIFAHILYINRRRMDLLKELTQKADFKGKDEVNKQLLLLIKDYLVMYDNYIQESDSRRAEIAQKLSDKVVDSLQSKDGTIKYQSISLAG